MRIVLQQVFAAWQKNSSVGRKPRFPPQVVASSPVDYNSKRISYNVIKQNYNVLNFMLRS